jgi:hypothetical protein
LQDLDILAEQGKLQITLSYAGDEIATEKININLKQINKTIIPENTTELILNIANITLVGNITEKNTSITTLQYSAIIGEPVKWKKKIKLDKPERITIKLPKEAENIFVIALDVEEESQEQQEEELEEYGLNLTEMDYTISLTGKIVSISADETLPEIEIVIDETATEFEIEYETPAPQAFEQNISGGKRIIISGPEELHYENILAYTFLPEEIKDPSKIRLHWINSESIENSTEISSNISNNTELLVRQEVQFVAYDTNENNLTDYIEWVVPHLSNQTYELSIAILNVHSFPSLYGNWTVEFETGGTADLTITATRDLNYTEEYTRWSQDSEDGNLYDLKFLEVKCGNETLSYEWQGENCYENECSVFISNYSCEHVAQEISKVVKARKHVLRFEFGGEVVYAYNAVVSTPYIWVANRDDANVSMLDSSNNYAETKYAVGDKPYGIAVDANNNIWVTNYDDNDVSMLNASNNYAETQYAVGDVLMSQC